MAVCHCGRVREPTSPLQIADYRRFWCGRLASVMATSGMVVVLGYQFYDIARRDYHLGIRESAFRLGLLGLVQFVPQLLLTPVAGVLADRHDRRHVGAAALGLDLIVALVLALATWAQVITLPLLFTLAAAHGMARVFVGPAVSAIAPNIVPAAILPRAIALNSIAMEAGTIVGPALAGLAFAVSRPLPYATAAVLIGVSMALVLSVRRLPPRADARTVHPFQQVVDGFRFIRAERFLLGCITLDLFAVLLGGATALLPIYARDILHVGSQGLGQMRAATAVGAGLVGLILSVRPLSRNVGAKMLVAVVIYGAATVVFGISRQFWLSLAALAVLGGADMVSMFVRSALIQLKTPDDKRGRVSAISGLFISASNELGEMQSGLAAALIGATGAVVLGGVGAVAVTLIWAALFPEIRRTRTFLPISDVADPPRAANSPASPSPASNENMS